MENTIFQSCLHSATLAFVLILSWPGSHCQSGQELIKGASVADILNFPYHVGIYKNVGGPDEYNQVCGGTLISTTLVVTAAHCFWNENIQAQDDIRLYRVTAGKTNRAWGFIGDSKSVQRRNVAKVTLQRRYIGIAQDLGNDIALVTLDRPVNLTSSVGLADIDWNDEWTSEQLAEGSSGTMTGWGLSETGSASDNIKFVSRPYVDPYTCFNALSQDLRMFLTQDKFCAGFLNRVTSVCRGDSGGGLVFHHLSTGKIFLRGIISLALKPAGNNDRCFAQHYAAFTKVSQDVVRVLMDDAKQGTRSIGPECGRRGRRATPLIAGGQDVVEGEFPWHVAVHEQRTSEAFGYLCGGSLISSKFVVTVAHWFYDESNATVKNASLYRVSAGAMMHVYGVAANLASAQTFSVAAITVHPQYTGLPGKLSNNLAVVQLDRPALFTRTVAPVCIDWGGAFEGDLRDGAVGVVPGLSFEYTPSGQYQDSFKWIELPYVNLETCANIDRTTGAEYFVFAPNFCAGAVNQSRGLCNTDAGGGFSVLHSANQRYYLRGVATWVLTPASFKGMCYSDGYTVMQTVGTPFAEWIRDVMLSAAE